MSCYTVPATRFTNSGRRILPVGVIGKSFITTMASGSL